MKSYMNQNLLRSDQQHLFKWTKFGIILHFGFTTTNLNELPVYDTIDLLEGLLEHELTINQRIDIKDVLKEFKERL